MAGVPGADQTGAARAGSLTMAPVPGGGAAPSAPYRPEMRRLGPNAVAIRVAPQARWVIIRSDSPLEVSRSEKLPAPEEPRASAAFAPEQRPASSAPANH